MAKAATALREAAGRIADLKGSAAEQARDLAALLDAALGHHQAHGDGPCPVCGNPDALTPAWRTATGQHRDRLRAEACAADEAASLAKTATTRAKALVQAPPQPLSSVTTDDPAAAALAAELAAWCAAAASARSEMRSVAALKAARQWLTRATAELHDQRLAPLADQSRSIWADLRQEINVGLGEFRLTGTNTRRQLDLDVTIDGVPSRSRLNRTWKPCGPPRKSN